MTDALHDAITRLGQWLDGSCDVAYAPDGDVRLVIEAAKELHFEEEAGDLHRKLNRRVAEALGKPNTGDNSSWHDIPEQVAALRVERDGLREGAEMAATELNKVTLELDEWRGHAALLTVHGITPPRPR